MKDQERFAQQWTRYLEGDLDESGLVELRELLAADKDLLEMAADLYQTHRLLGLIATENATQHDEFVRDTLARLPIDQNSFVSGVISEATDLGREPTPNATRKVPAILPRGAWPALAATLAAMIMGILSFSFWPEGRPRIANDDVDRTSIAMAEGNVRLASLANAKFFGELPPPIDSVFPRKRDYVLMSGLVEVAFPRGASAIIEGPALFRVLSDESLGLDIGRCSVHAPDGAEGFRIETPVTRVVDRGTRFTVSVSETSETAVQVIEGAADIYSQPKQLSRRTSQATNGRPALEIRVTDGEAQKFTNVGAFSADSIPFDPDLYRRWLPDRVVSYRATTAADGGAKDLISVAVQRGGELFEIPVERLIAAEVTWFKGHPGNGHGYLVSDRTLPKRRREMFSDRSLVTGVINPGGSRDPLTSDPVIDPPGDSSKSGTPGMAVRFQSPVRNGPGADVVFFDLQMFSHPLDGDAFHVSPLKFKEGLKSHTIRLYDLTMESPDALDLAGFSVFYFDKLVQSLAMLEAAKCTASLQAIKFRALAVGIDLSDLGYAPGEEVDGLFFQDALDDKHFIDPVFIGGLPALEERNP